MSHKVFLQGESKSTDSSIPYRGDGCTFPSIYGTPELPSRPSRSKCVFKITLVKNMFIKAFLYRVTKVLGDTDYVDINMRVASSL